MKGLIITGIIAVVIGAISFGMWMNYNNTQIELREKVVAQQEVCKANYDKMFKVISQVAQVPEQFMEKSKEAFKEIYPELMEGRYGNDRGGAMMSWVTESNPQFDMGAASKLYENIQIAVEANREEYFVQQAKLIDMNRAHTVYVTKVGPRQMFLSDTSVIEITIITSTVAEKVYETGKDDDIKLF
jgi:predicted negative regulator of RcsB-dependent stress response